MSRARELVVRVRGMAEGFPQVSKTVQDTVSKVGESSERARGRVERAFDKLAGAVVKAGKRIAQAGIATAIGLIAVSLKKGWDRLTGIENAEASLRGLGHSAAEVDSIMKAALGSVKGTAFGMDEAAQTASTVVAASGAQGEELQRILTIIADAAVIGKTSMTDMGAIFNKVAAGGKVTTEVMNQLTDRGIGGFAALAEHLGVTQDKVREMVTRGEVDFETFAAAMESKLGGAAQEAGQTVQGAMANVGSALGRIGANVLQGAFSKLPALFQSVQKWLEPLEDRAKSAGEAIGAWLAEAAEKLQAGFARVRPVLGTLQAAVGRVGEAFGGVLSKVRDVTGAVDVDVWGSLRGVIGDVAGALFDMADWLDRNADSIANVVRWAKENTGIFKGLALVIGGMVVGIKAYRAALAVKIAITKAWIVVTKGVAIAQKALNLVMRANPIGLIITGIILLVAGLVKLYRENETFRRIVDRAWSAVKGAVLAVVDWFRNTAVPWLKEAWEKIKGGFGSIADTAARVWESIKGAVQTGIDFVARLFLNFTGPGLIIKHWETIKGAFSSAWSWVKSVFGVWWSGLTTIVRAPVDLAKSAIDTLLGAGSGIRALFNSVWTWAKNTFSSVWSGLTSILRAPIDLAKSAIEGILGGIEGVFTRARDGIGRIWDGIKGKLSGPIDWVKTRVINPFLQAVKNFLNGIGAGDLAGKIKLLDTAATSGAKSGASAAVPGRQGGGRVPGTWSAARRDHVLGLDERGVPIVRIEPEEMVIRRASAKAIDRMFPGYLDAINARGAQAVAEYHGPLPRLPRHAGGGRVKPVPHRHSGWNGGRYRRGGWHGGVDYASPMGTPIKAAAAGKVTKAQALTRSYGHHVIMSHAGGWSTLYAHMSRILTQVGRILSAGSVIGRVGSTGNSTGPHLHFEARHHGRQVNPDTFLAGASYGATPTGAAAAGAAGAAPGLSLSGSAMARSDFERAIDKIVNPILKRVETIGGGWFGESMGRMPRYMYEGVKAEARKMLFDQGGMLEPGFTLVENRSGRPERVLTDDQWDALTREPVVNVYVQVPGGEFKKVAREQARVEIRHRERTGARG